MELTLEYETEAFRAWTEKMISEMRSSYRRDFLRATALEFVSRVIQRTPVDEGRARGGWASYALANGQPVRSQGPGFMEGVSEGWYAEKFSGHDAAIIIVNAVPYIVMLEYGWSKQAPAGMMRVTFREMRGGRTGPLSEIAAAQLRKTVYQVNRTARRPRLPG